MCKLMGMIKKNANYLCAEHLPDEADTILTIKEIREETITNPQDNRTEVKAVCHFVEDVKPLVLNVTNGESIVAATGAKNIEDMIGKKIALYVARVKAFGGVVDAIRIRDKAPSVNIVKCADCGAEVKAPRGKTVEEMVSISKKNCGRVLCLACMKKEKKRQDEAAAAAKAEAEAKAQAEAEVQPEAEPAPDDDLKVSLLPETEPETKPGKGAPLKLAPDEFKVEKIIEHDSRPAANASA